MPVKEIPVRLLIAIISVLTVALAWQGTPTNSTSPKPHTQVAGSAETAPGIEAAPTATAVVSPSAITSPETVPPHTASNGSPHIAKLMAVRSGSATPPGFGMQFHGTWDVYYQGTSATPNEMFGKHLDQLSAHGVKLLRVDVGWSSSQPDRSAPDPNSSYNQRIQRVLTEASKRDMGVMLTLWRSPAWARPATGSVNQFPINPADITPWATWMAKTYGSQVAAWQVWNEPNIVEFTGIENAGDRAVKYVPILKAVHQGLRAGDSDATIVFGGPAQNDDAFIDQTYRLGAKNYFDIMAVHPYQGNQTRPPEVADPGYKYYTTHFATIAEVMKRNGDGNKPVWWTEFGYSVHSNAKVPKDMSWRNGVANERTSADYLRRAFELVRTQYPQVAAIFVYTAYREGNDPYGHESGYSMLHADGTPRAQLTALRDYFMQHQTAVAPRAR